MEKEILLGDKLELSDSGKVRGHVVVTRAEDGKVLFRKDNMIVENGRKYIRDLVFGAVGGTLSNTTTKITTLKFGTGTAATLSSDNALGSAASYDTTTATLDWRLQTNTVYTGYFGVTGDPGETEVNDGEFLLFLDENELYVGSDGEWVLIETPLSQYFFDSSEGSETLYENDGGWSELIPTEVVYFSPTLNVSPVRETLHRFNSVWSEPGTSGTAFPSSPSENDLFYNRDSAKLYLYTNAMVITSLADPQIGLLFDITRTGSDPAQTISELGLFTNDSPTPKMFSRLVFDGVPFSSSFTYNIKYYLYF